MRIRSIKPEFFKHDDLSSLNPLARILFIGLWCMADCAGRLEDRPKRIKAEVLPYDECDVDALLNSIEGIEGIFRYEVDGQKLIQIQNFERHQRITGKESESESRFPAMQKKRTVKQRGNIGETLGKQLESLEGKGDGREGKGDDKPSLREELSRMECYRTLSVETEINKMQGWLSTRPQRRFTKKFAINWLNRALEENRVVEDVPFSSCAGSEMMPVQVQDPSAVAEMRRKILEHHRNGR